MSWNFAYGYTVAAASEALACDPRSLGGEGELERETGVVLPKITGEQIKAARMLLNWDVSTLARQSGVDNGLIQVFEAGQEGPKGAQALIIETLEIAGIEFPDRETVRLKIASMARAG